ncbi:hypothetical protein ACLM5H_04990 [Fredinandcohnia humi]
MLETKGLCDVLRVSFIDGLVLNGDTYQEIVEKLQESSFDETPSLDDYMKRVEKRVQLQTGESISYDDFESFVSELKRVNIVTQIENVE